MGILALVLLPTWDCRTCTAGQKQTRGCDEDTLVPYQLDGEDFYRCPRRPIYEEPEMWSEVLSSFYDYQANRYPEAGGMQDQPYQYLELMRVMSSAKYEAEEVKEKQRQAKDQAANPNL